MDPVIHFEMPAKDRERIANFYSAVFGWKSQMHGEDFGNYVTVSTTETGEDGRPTSPGAINGGFYPVTPDMPPQYPSFVISVRDLKDAIKRITSAGGRIDGEPTNIPGIGDFVYFTDTEGNRASILQPAE
jgi:hypothetical protein